MGVYIQGQMGEEDQRQGLRITNIYGGGEKQTLYKGDQEGQQASWQETPDRETLQNPRERGCCWAVSIASFSRKKKTRTYEVSTDPEALVHAGPGGQMSG